MNSIHTVPPTLRSFSRLCLDLPTVLFLSVCCHCRVTVYGRQTLKTQTAGHYLPTSLIRMGDISLAAVDVRMHALRRRSKCQTAAGVCLCCLARVESPPGRALVMLKQDGMCPLSIYTPLNRAAIWLCLLLSCSHSAVRASGRMFSLRTLTQLTIYSCNCHEPSR
jgi:hypothetical protein